MNFYSKILLFGEYAVTRKSKALCLPFFNFQGSLDFISSPLKIKENESSIHLYKFYSYLKKNKFGIEGKGILNLDKFKEDLEKGLYFKSSIPQGYGVGSSGALVAAVYNRYVVLKEKNLIKLKNVLAFMESHFHKKSSGIDPLISCLNQPVLIDSGALYVKDTPNMKFASTSDSMVSKAGVFLIDSGVIRDTARMMNNFLELLKQEKFREKLFQKFIQQTNLCVDYFIKGDFKGLFDHVKELSKLALHTFKEMVPDGFLELWEQGIKTGSYFLKLCGAGGGGYVLGFSENIQEARKQLKDYQIQVIYSF